MTIWIVYYNDNVSKNKVFINRLIDKGTKAGLHMELVIVEEINDRLIRERPDGVIARMINPQLTYRLNMLGIRVFNNYEVSYMCNNKALTIKNINRLGLVHIPTAIIRQESNNYEIELVYSNETDNIITKYNYILSDIENTNLSQYVIKSVSGHGGKEVCILDEYIKKGYMFGTQQKDAAEYYSEKYVIQPLINCGGRDLRVYVLGNEIIGAVLRTSDNGFKSNYSLGGNVKLYSLNDMQKDIIYKIINCYAFDYVGIDFLLDEDDNLIFNEIEDVVGARMLSATSDIDYCGLYIDYICRELA